MKKLLVVGVIVLFLGLACAPSINANISRDNELVEITTEICGLGGGKHTAQLTKDEAEEVEQYLDSIKGKLNKAKTRVEIIAVFYEVIQNLNGWRVLPKSASVTQIQNFINEPINFINDGSFNNFQTNEKQSGFPKINFMCLISGKTNWTYFHSRLSALLYITIMLLARITIPFLFIISYIASIYLNHISNISLGNQIGFGYIVEDLEIGEVFRSPAYGWIFTIGILGIRSKNGTIWGDFNFDIFGIVGSGTKSYFPGGVIGFTGIKVDINDSSYYQGFAKIVKFK